MAIYVDQLRGYPIESIKPAARRYGRIWCHLVTDCDIEELHAFAERIGLPRSWFQVHSRLSHYDLTPAKRQIALSNGAVELQTLAPIFQKLWDKERNQ